MSPSTAMDQLTLEAISTMHARADYDREAGMEARRLDAVRELDAARDVIRQVVEIHEEWTGAYRTAAKTKGTEP